MSIETTPHIIQEVLNKKDALENNMRKVLERVGFKLLTLTIDHRGPYFVLGVELELFRDQSNVVCFSFSPANNRYVKGVSEIKGSAGEFEYQSKGCTFGQINEAVVQGLDTHLVGFKNEITAFKYFNCLAREFRVIKGCRFSTDEEDNRGIDIVVSVERNPGDKIIDVPIQVKSSRHFQNNHRKNFRMKNIPSMVVPKRRQYHALAQRMKDLLTEYVLRRKILHI